MHACTLMSRVGRPDDVENNAAVGIDVARAKSIMPDSMHFAHQKDWQAIRQHTQVRAKIQPSIIQALLSPCTTVL